MEALVCFVLYKNMASFRGKSLRYAVEFHLLFELEHCAAPSHTNEKPSPFAGEGLACYTLRDGDEENRTPVRKPIHANFYEFSLLSRVAPFPAR